MANFRIATRYAEALMTAAEEQQVLNRVASDVETLDRIIKSSRHFLLFLKSPVINREKKQNVLSELFGKKLHALTLGFLQLLAEKRREDVLGEICEQFFSLHDTQRGIVGVGIQAATELTKEQQNVIQKKFEEITKKSVRLSVRMEKDLRGGFLARVGDTVFDGSVRRQLELLRERFAEGAGIE